MLATCVFSTLQHLLTVWGVEARWCVEFAGCSNPTTRVGGEPTVAAARRGWEAAAARRSWQGPVAARRDWERVAAHRAR
jgi:hypothetical protein